MLSKYKMNGEVGLLLELGRAEYVFECVGIVDQSTSTVDEALIVGQS